MITITDIAKKTMTEEKRKSARKNIFAYYIGRPISYAFSIPFILLKIKPNVITIISMVFSICGFVFVSFPICPYHLIIGWVSFFLWNIFDGVDGNVARYNEDFSKNGTLFDATAGYLQIFLSFSAFGIASYYYTGYLSTLFPNFPSELFIVFGFLSSFFELFPRLVFQKKKNTNNNETSSLEGKENYGFFKVLALNVSSASGFIQIIMLGICICSIFGFYFFDIFTVVYLSFNFVFSFVTLFKLLSK